MADLKRAQPSSQRQAAKMMNVSGAPVLADEKRILLQRVPKPANRTRATVPAPAQDRGEGEAAETV